MRYSLATLLPNGLRWGLLADEDYEGMEEAILSAAIYAEQDSLSVMVVDHQVRDWVANVQQVDGVAEVAYNSAYITGDPMKDWTTAEQST